MPDRLETVTKANVARRVSEMWDSPLNEPKDWVGSVLTVTGTLMRGADAERRIDIKNSKAEPPARTPQTNETGLVLLAAARLRPAHLMSKVS